MSNLNNLNTIMDKFLKDAGRKAVVLTKANEEIGHYIGTGTFDGAENGFDSLLSGIPAIERAARYLNSDVIVQLIFTDKEEDTLKIVNVVEGKLCNGGVFRFKLLV